jgi:hypothetical protein
MVCVLVPLLLKRNIGMLFRVLSGPRSDTPFLFSLLWLCIVVMSGFFRFAVF